MGWKPLPVPVNFRLAVVVATYRQGPKLRCLLESLAAQTCQQWEVVVVHDGPWDPAELAALPPCGRVDAVHTPDRANVYGHNCREFGRRLLASRRPDDRPTHVLFTNGDNYYAPVAVEVLLNGVRDADLAYSGCVHSHKGWAPLPARLERGHVDVGAWCARADWVFATPWDKTDFAADWDYLSRLLERRPRTRAVAPYLLVHN